MKSKLVVGVVAPCAPVGSVELQLGAAMLRESGFDVVIHPSCSAQHFVFAGSDETRAEALLDYAREPAIDVIWAARGGYGAARLLPILDERVRIDGKPPVKLLVGYSDITALHAYVGRNWSWNTLHAPMVGSDLRSLPPRQWQATVNKVRGAPDPWLPTSAPLRWLTAAPAEPIRAELVGGNLSVLASLCGTPYAIHGDGKILFLEDVGEKPYRLDRLANQLDQSGALKGAAAIVLGDFKDCGDETVTCLASDPGADPQNPRRVPLRPIFSTEESLIEIFGSMGKRLGVPVAAGLPAGHGPGFYPLPLGAQYEIAPGGTLRLVQWDWKP